MGGHEESEPVIVVAVGRVVVVAVCHPAVDGFVVPRAATQNMTLLFRPLPFANKSMFFSEM